MTLCLESQTTQICSQLDDYDNNSVAYEGLYKIIVDIIMKGEKKSLLIAC